MKQRSALIRCLLSSLFLVFATKSAYGIIAYKSPIYPLVYIFMAIEVVRAPIGALALAKTKSKSGKKVLGVCTVVSIFIGVLATGAGILKLETYTSVFGLSYLSIGLFSRWIHQRLNQPG